MATRHSTARAAGLGQLWQVPLLAVALGLFGFAAYLFIDPHAGPTIDQKIDVARKMLKSERPEAAINALNRILLAEKLDREHEGVVHLLLGQSLAALQQQKHLSLKTYHEQVVEQSQLALNMGVRTTYEIERRLGESYEALGRQAKALEHYRQAAAMDPDHALRLQRKVIELQLATGDVGPAEASLDAYLQVPDLADGERAWALCNRAKLLVDKGEFVRGRGLLDRAAKLDSDPAMQGQVAYYQGYCAAKTGDSAGAERLLLSARQLLRPDNPLDADAACLLGQLAADRNDPKTAASFYQDVLVNHAESSAVPAAMLGRGLARLADSSGSNDDAGLTDLHELTRRTLAADPPVPADNATVAAGLSQAASMLAARGNYSGAIELLDGEQQLDPRATPEFYHQLSTLFERRADQVERDTDVMPAAYTQGAASPTVTAADAVRRAKAVRDLLTHAADGAVAEARALTLADDKGYGQALWRGIDLYDRASDLPAAIDALQLFVAERPTDPLAPTALYRLGRAYQTAGQFDKAIAAYQRNQFLYPNSLAASRSAVPLAEAYMARGPADYPRAESVLRNVIEGNPLLTPESEEFRQALFELARLYYRTDRYEQAIARLNDWTARYADDDRMGQALFLTADSYRKSAALLDPRTNAIGVSAVATTRPAVAVIDQAEAAAARRDRLELARAAYDGVVSHYRDVPAKTDLDRLYNKLAHFYRADCLYDSGRYEEAIRQYDAAAFRYQDDPSSLAAYVQIVNAYYALGKPDEARAANERAKVMLRQMPPEAFSNDTFAMPKEYWENQLRWATGAGMW
jgi:tetratricopeptide (TPR) repeat protein